MQKVYYGLPWLTPEATLPNYDTMTVRDIALEAGVSIATVSRVINKKPVSLEKVALVEAAMAKLGYQPNMVNVGLERQPGRAIGIIGTSMSNPYYLEIAETIAEKLQTQGISTWFTSSNNDAKKEQACIKECLDRDYSGIILIDPVSGDDQSEVLRYAATKIPLVLVHGKPGEHRINSVLVDQATGMRQVLAQLVELGHRDIGFIRGRHGYSYDIKEQTWRDFLTKAGYPPSIERLLVIEEGNTEKAVSQSETAIHVASARSALPSAIFACNDLMATGVIKALRARGIDVPGKVSVWGYDNTILAASLGISSVDLKMRSMGLAAVDLLNHAMESPDPEIRQISIAPALVPRGTHARRWAFSAGRA